MPVNLVVPEYLHSIKGVRYAAIASGIKKNGRLDLVAIELNEKVHIAAVFTQNKFCAAPVTVAKKHLNTADSIRYLLINSGNANAGTGEQGFNDAVASCQKVADLSGCDVNQVLPFSTGVIAEPLPIQKIKIALPELLKNLDIEAAMQAAEGILTTDIAIKAVTQQIEIDGEKISITGFVKGSGMIKPNMATMLAYVFTDASINQNSLNTLLHEATNLSFNAITVDGDTSTNDACVLVSTQQSKCQIDDSNQLFKESLNSVFKTLAQNIIRDGEGATKFVTIHVESALNNEEAKELAFTIAHSPLVKTALFASDPNWGRILAAVGRANISCLEIDKVDLYLGDECLVNSGQPNPSYSEDKATEIMQQDEIEIKVCLNVGDAKTTVWTTDLSYDYVKINAEYRS